uniref:DND microRNA-mediated repression inhibitor 1 n=1 Tax=Catharus ustulatus TaxID=91951 RepID=A0A8C3ULB2_CATUS
MLPAGRLLTQSPPSSPPSGMDQQNHQGKMALLAWQEETGIELVQINGQRRYGGPPPGWVGGPPPAGTEVYIARLPQDIYENTLIPLFQSVGMLYEFRLMLTFSGLNRGFAFARYASPQDAHRAIDSLHRYQLRPGCTIVVCWSTQKRELVLSGLGMWVSQQELEVRLQLVTEGICSVTLHNSPYQGQAKLAVLKYKSHEAAALARKALMEGNLRLREAGIRVDWLDSQLKKKLQQLCEEEPLSISVQGGNNLAVPGAVAPCLPLEDVLECLNMLCWKLCLRKPVFLIKCVLVKPNGWQKFWYQVVIPGFQVLVTDFTWVFSDRHGLSEFKKAKVAAALHTLQLLS